jgi:hypothetical protein
MWNISIFKSILKKIINNLGLLTKYNIRIIKKIIPGNFGFAQSLPHDTTPTNIVLPPIDAVSGPLI